MRKRMLATIALALVLVLGMATVASATTPCASAPWCGKVYTQGYWKNKGAAPCLTVATKTYRIATPKGGDYGQIFVNQAIAFHNNYMLNACCNGTRFRDAVFYSGKMGAYDYLSVEHLHQIALYVLEVGPNKYCRQDVLMLKDALDWMNNGMYLRQPTK